MALTQETVLKFLVEQGGKAKNSELLNAFKCIINSCDVTEEKHNRELFKMFINNIAVVKEIEGMKYIVMKKRYQYLLKGDITLKPQNSKLLESLDCSKSLSPSEFRGCSHDEVGKILHSELDNDNIPIVSSTSDDRLNSNYLNNNSFNSPTELPEQLCRSFERKAGSVFAIVAVKTHANEHGAELQDRQDVSNFKILNQGTSESFSKPHMMLLKMSQTQLNTVADCRDMYMVSEADPCISPKTKRRQVEECAAPGSPNMRRGHITKPGDQQPKYSETIPLERTEHEWLVHSAAGHWTQVYGLLLEDSQLAEKKDFMSGFTALHWAAKSGKSEMVRKIIETSKRAGVHIDVNGKTHGGYTPLHIAAIHGQECVITLLVSDYGADTNIRDNSGKKPYHYMLKSVSPELRMMLGEPQVLHETNAERHDDVHFHDLHKGFHSFSRLFHPHVGHKKKPKRTSFSSISEDVEVENEDNAVKPRTLLDIFH